MIIGIEEADAFWVLEVDGPVTVPDTVMSGEDFTMDTDGGNFTVQAKGTDGDWMFRVASGTRVDSGMQRQIPTSDERDRRILR